MVDCPNRKGIRHAAFLFPVSLSGPWGLDLLAPAPWVVQPSGVVTPTHRESTVRANGEHRDRWKRKWGQLGRWTISFSRNDKKGKKCGINLNWSSLWGLWKYNQGLEPSRKAPGIAPTNPLPFGVDDFSLLVCFKKTRFQALLVQNGMNHLRKLEVSYKVKHTTTICLTNSMPRYIYSR